MFALLVDREREMQCNARTLKKAAGVAKGPINNLVDWWIDEC
jgi:hypothetical protein